MTHGSNGETWELMLMLYLTVTTSDIRMHLLQLGYQAHQLGEGLNSLYVHRRGNNFDCDCPGELWCRQAAEQGWGGEP